MYTSITTWTAELLTIRIFRFYLQIQRRMSLIGSVSHADFCQINLQCSNDRRPEQ